MADFYNLADQKLFKDYQLYQTWETCFDVFIFVNI